MSRYFRLGVICCQFVLAIALTIVGMRFPAEREIRNSFSKVDNITEGSQKQIAAMRKQVTDLRQHDYARSTASLKANSRRIADTLTQQQIDFASVEKLGSAFGDVAKAIDAWSEVIDPEKIRAISDSLAAAAQFIDPQLVETAQKTAQNLEKQTQGLEESSRRLAEFLRKAPPDLQALRSIHDALGSIEMGLGKFAQLGSPDQLSKMQDGLKGMEKTLSSVADQSDKMSGLTYPIVTVRGLKLDVDQKPFWPEGKNIAGNLRKSSAGLEAMGKEFESFSKALPDVRKSLEDSQKAISGTRATLAKTLQNEKEIEKVMADSGRQLAGLAEALPRMSADLTRLLKEVEKLKSLAEGLRSIHKSLQAAAERWPTLTSGVKKSSTVLKEVQGRLTKVAEQREVYEKAMQGTAEMARGFSDSLPQFVEQIDDRLEQHEKALSQMEQGISELRSTMPQAEETTTQLLQAIRYLFWALAALIALHAISRLFARERESVGSN